MEVKNGMSSQVQCYLSNRAIFHRLNPNHDKKSYIPVICYSKQGFISRGVALGKEGVVIRIAMILDYIRYTYLYIHVYVSLWVLSHRVRRLSFSVGDTCKLSFQPQSFQPF